MKVEKGTKKEYSEKEGKQPAATLKDKTVEPATEIHILFKHRHTITSNIVKGNSSWGFLLFTFSAISILRAIRLENCITKTYCMLCLCVCVSWWCSTQFFKSSCGYLKSLLLQNHQVKGEYGFYIWNKKGEIYVCQILSTD